jgi:hypothetical protein
VSAARVLKDRASPQSQLGATTECQLRFSDSSH